MDAESIDAALAQVAPQLRQIMHRLAHELDRLNLPEAVTLLTAEQVQWRLSRDPASGQYALIGLWQNAAGYRCGSLAFHADGSYFVEQDLLKPHPNKPAWFVEALTVWGKNDQMVSEPRLIAMP